MLAFMKLYSQAGSFSHLAMTDKMNTKNVRKEKIDKVTLCSFEMKYR
jgi:hypothetical protein